MSAAKSPDPSSGSSELQLTPTKRRIEGEVDDHGSPLAKKIEELKAERKRLQKEKKQKAQELRNAERKRQRLKSKAKQLNNNDLMEVYKLRQVEAADREAKAQCKAKAT